MNSMSMSHNVCKFHFTFHDDDDRDYPVMNKKLNFLDGIFCNNMFLNLSRLIFFAHSN